MAHHKDQEGFVSVTGGRVWYRIIGEGSATPLLTLHGGPGFPHNYLEPLADLANERPVIFYDQLGCGRSDRPEDPDLWHIRHFVEQLARLRDALGLTRFHILGHSWGTMLAADYALTQPPGLEKLVLASPALSIPRWMEDAWANIRAMPDDLRAALEQRAAGRPVDDELYQQADAAYARRHMCRLDSRPEPLQIAAAGFNREIYHTMWGPSEWEVTGNLKDYDRVSRLHEIGVPTLFTCGRYDEATPETTAYYRQHVSGAKLAVFEQSSHMPHLEEPDAYLRVVRDFLR